MQEKKRGRTHSRWLLPAALVLAPEQPDGDNGWRGMV